MRNLWTWIISYQEDSCSLFALHAKKPPSGVRAFHTSYLAIIYTTDYLQMWHHWSEILESYGGSFVVSFKIVWKIPIAQGAENCAVYWKKMQHPSMKHRKGLLERKMSMPPHQVTSRWFSLTWASRNARLSNYLGEFRVMPTSRLRRKLKALSIPQLT